MFLYTYSMQSDMQKRKLLLHITFITNDLNSLWLYSNHNLCLDTFDRWFPTAQYDILTGLTCQKFRKPMIDNF